ncbi:MAG: AI-2E family transporter YdiK [Burkholderiales bacterium]
MADNEPVAGPPGVRDGSAEAVPPPAGRDSMRSQRNVMQPLPVTVRQDIARTTFGVLFIVGLIAACFWILRPFLPAFIWATMIVVATWSTLLELQEKLWNRRWIAVTIMTSALILAFVVPFWLAISTLVEHAEEITGWVQSISRAQLPPLPGWVEALPYVGPKIAAAWNEVATTGPSAITAKIEPYARGIARWFVGQVGGLGVMALQFLLTIIVAAVMYMYGESVVEGARLFFRRLVGARGDEVIELSGQAIRGVAFGVVVTAFVQSVLGGVGLTVAGIPFAGLLTALMFVLAIAQIGAAPILFCAVAWMYWVGDTGWATALLVWTILVSSMDNVLRPILIRRGGRLPLLLVFAGVIGGLVAFGLVGIFVGPLVLAVSYRLIDAWVREGSEPQRT